MSVSRHRMRQPISLLLCLALTGCGAYFAPDRNVKEKLADKDVIGAWSMSTNSLALLVRDGFRAAPTNRYTITFLANGTCSFQSVASFAGQHRYVPVNGTWKLEHDTQGKKVNTLRLELPFDGVDHIQYWNFARDHGVLILWNYHGDPDQWEFVEYAHDG